jgi:hypothetical protein
MKQEFSSDPIHKNRRLTAMFAGSAVVASAFLGNALYDKGANDKQASIIKEEGVPCAIFVATGDTLNGINNSIYKEIGIQVPEELLDTNGVKVEGAIDPGKLPIGDTIRVTLTGPECIAVNGKPS